MAHTTKAHNTPHPRRFRPLNTVQLNAIDLLLTGSTDGEAAAAVGVTRETVWGWRHEHPLFQATLECRRADLWRAPHEKLRALALKAADNLTAAVEAGDLKASVELLKCIGLYGVATSIGETDPDVLLRQQVEARLEEECPTGVMHEFLIDQARPGWHQRKRAIEAELWGRYGADPPAVT